MPSTASVGEVADARRDALATRLRPQPLKHRLGGIDPVDLEAALGERQRDPSGADAQLEDRARSRELRERGHGLGSTARSQSS